MHKSKGKPMHKSKGKNTRSAQVLHSQIPPKATNACGGRREEEQRRTQQMELQELDRKGSTHLEGKRFGGNVDLGLLLQSSKDQRVWVEGLGDLVILELAIMVSSSLGELAVPR